VLSNLFPSEGGKMDYQHARLMVRDLGHTAAQLLHKTETIAVDGTRHR